MHLPFLLAADIATQTGICGGIPGDNPIFATIRFGQPGDDHFQVGGAAMRWIATRLRDDPPDQLWLEETSLRPTDTRDIVLRLSGLFMIFGAAARTKGVPVRTLDVRTIRTAFLGNGNLKRDEAKRRVRAMCRLLGWTPRNDDEADAGAIWWNACAICCPNLTPKISPSMRAHVALPPLAVVS